MADAQRNLSYGSMQTGLVALTGMLTPMGAGQGGRIRARRTQLGLTMTELGGAVGVSRVTIHNWENTDDMDIKRSRLHKLARKLKCSESYITDNGPIAESRASNGPIDTELLVDCLVSLDEGLEGRAVTLEKRAEIIAAIYEMFAEQQERPSRATLVKFVKRIA